MAFFGKKENLAKQLAAKSERIQALEEELAAVKAEDEQPADEPAEEPVEEQVDELEDRVAKLEGDVAALTARVEKLESDLAEERKEGDEARAQVKALEERLANPAAAYQDASAGRKAVREGGAEAQEGSLWAKYHAISDPSARTTFWRENREALRAENNVKK